MRTLLFLLTLALPLAAQDPARVGVTTVERRITLRDSIEMALAHNLDIEIEKSNTALAGEALRGARGAYDPHFRWQPMLQSSDTPAGSVLQASDGRLEQRGHSENFYFDKKLPWNGSAIGLSFENSRQSSTNPFLSLDPYVSSRLGVTFTMPLLRGRTIDAERATIRIRRKQLDISETQFELKTIDVITRVEQSYWDLSAARQDATVKADSVEWAREQLARTKRMVDAGNLAQVEISAAEAELERRLDSWYTSIGAITEAENTLKTLLADGHDSPLWTEALIPLDDQKREPADSDDWRAAVKQAIGARPELKVLASQRQVNDVEKKQNADQVKPQFNLVAGYSSTGLGGSRRAGLDPFSAASVALYDRVNKLSAQQGLAAVPAPSLGVTPGSLTGGYGAALSNLFGSTYRTLQAGVSMDFTIHNRQAEANLAQSVITEKRLGLAQAQWEQAIAADVRNALQALQTARQRIAAADASARAAREKLDSETRLFQTGESTNFLVLTRQNEYADSRHRLLVANLDFNKAVSKLQQATGSTLASNGVTLK